MKIQLVSDLHMEFWKKDRHMEVFDYTDADVLVVAGDLHVGRTNTAKALNKFAEHYENVVYVAGNHEFYNGCALDDFHLNVAPNVHYLDNRKILIGDVTFSGASLFTNFGDDVLAVCAAERGIADFRRIPDATPAEYAQRFRDSSEWFKYVYEEFEGPHVFVSHWLPAMQCVHPRWKSDSYTMLLNKYFANDLGPWIETLDNVTWMFGHTHDSVDMKIGNTRMLCNPYGYEGSLDRNVEFKRNLVNEV